MVYWISILFIILVSFPLQEFAPDFTWAYHSKVLLVHSVFFAAAVSVPFPVMLIYALVAGFIWECRYHMPIGNLETAVSATQFELPFGFTILIFGLLGVFIQGVRPFFRQGRWGLPVLMVGVCTLLGLLIEYLVISFNRGGLFMSTDFWFKILMTALFSTLLAPFLLLLFSRIANLTGYQISLEGITRRYSYDGNDI